MSTNDPEHSESQTSAGSSAAPAQPAAPTGETPHEAPHEEGWLETIESGLETIESGIEEIATQPPAVVFMDVLKIDLPYIIMLSVAIAAIGYISFTGEPTLLLLEILAPVYAITCIMAGWRHTHDRPARVKLVWSQILHWLGCFVAMNVIYLGPVRTVANNNAASLALMTILALSTFLAGVHAGAWQICVVAAILAAAVPAMAMVQTSSFFIVVIALGALFIVATLWATTHAERRKVEKTA